MRCILIAALIIISLSIDAQNFDHYTTLLPQGIVPKDFTELSSSKIASDINSISSEKGGHTNMKKKFFIESTFSIDEFLTSGNVLFNDEVSTYLDNILTELLNTYPELRKKIRVYAVKSSTVNAFTTNSGMIFVNLGLLSRLDNEAQLAFILSHEIIHFQKKHVLNKYITNIEIDRSKNYRKLSLSEKGFTKSTFSKEQESEADLDGSDIYAAGTWTKDSVDKVFDILSHADLPLTWSPFSKTVFESGLYVFPDTLTLKIIRPINIDEDYDDSKKTHPNIKKRRETIANRFKDASGGSDFKVSKTRFYTVKKISQYELCRLHLLDHRYVESLALALSLRSENPKSSYINESIAKALYGLAKTTQSETIKLDEDQWIGEAERLSAFIQKQSPYELSVLAIRELNNCLEATPQNQEIILMLNDLIRSFAENNENVEKNFLTTSNQKEIENLPYPYTQYAFLDFKNVNDFFLLFMKAIGTAKKTTKSSDKKISSKRTPLNLKKIVVVSPIYKNVDARRKKRKVRHMKTEEALININDKIKEAANKLAIKTEIINLHKISKHEVAMMQNNSIMSDWLAEQMLCEDKMISPIYNEVLAVAEQYQTDHFVWMGNITLLQSKLGKGSAIFFAVLLPSLTPWTLGFLLTPGGSTLYFALSFNVRTQEVELIDIRQMGMRDRESLLSSNIYYTLFNLKH